MATRRKSSTITSKDPPPPKASTSDSLKSPEPNPAGDNDESHPVAPPKLGLILPTAAIFYILFFYLAFSHYSIDPELRRSIAINAAMSLVGFILAVRIILAVRSVGDDIALQISKAYIYTLSFVSSGSTGSTSSSAHQFSRRAVNPSRRLHDAGGITLIGAMHHKLRALPLLTVGVGVVVAVFLIVYTFGGTGRFATRGALSANGGLLMDSFRLGLSGGEKEWALSMGGEWGRMRWMRPAIDGWYLNSGSEGDGEGSVKGEGNAGEERGICLDANCVEVAGGWSRQRLNDQLYMLRSIVSKISKASSSPSRCRAALRSTQEALTATDVCLTHVPHSQFPLLAH